MAHMETIGFCPFRSVIPTTQAKLGHAKTGMSERDCDGHNCMLWIEQGETKGCAFALAARAIIERQG
jgi:uncharacterized membrane protein